MYNGVIPTLTGSKPGRFAKRGVSGLLSFAGERGSFIGFGRLNCFLHISLQVMSESSLFFLHHVFGLFLQLLRTCSDPAFGLFAVIAVISRSSIHGEWPVMNSNKRTNTGYRFAIPLQKTHT